MWQSSNDFENIFLYSYVAYSTRITSAKNFYVQRTPLVKTRGGLHEDVLGLEDTFWNSWPWPRSLKSSKIALSSTRGQRYFLNSWNFVGKRQKPRGKFANTFFVFLTWSIGVGKKRGGMGASQMKFHQWQKCDKKAYCFFSFSFFLAFFADNK